MPIRQDFIQGFVANRGLLSTAELFHENTKFRRYEAAWGSDFSQQALQDVYRQVTNPYKSYSGRLIVQLPRRRLAGGLARALRKRRSVRNFTGAPVTRTHISRLLGSACGITGAHDLGAGRTMLVRAAPSAGSLFPLELYVIVLAGRDIDEGVYHYAPREHALERIAEGNFRRPMFEATLKEASIAQASLAIVMTAVSARSMFKYGDRAYRYMLIEAGHIAQNLYLLAGRLGLGGYTIGGFIDDSINELVEVDGVNEYALYLFVAGARVSRWRGVRLRHMGSLTRAAWRALSNRWNAALCSRS